MFDSMALRDCSKSLPVSCIYRRMAWTLSPEAFSKQSLATEQGSPALSAIPSTPFEITQASRGRLVSRRIFSVGYESSATVVAVDSSSAQVMIMCASVSTSKSGMVSLFPQNVFQKRGAIQMRGRRKTGFNLTSTRFLSHPIVYLFGPNIPVSSPGKSFVETIRTQDCQKPTSTADYQKCRKMFSPITTLFFAKHLGVNRELNFLAIPPNYSS